MRKSLIIGGSALLSVIAIPAIAVAAGGMDMMPGATMKRADVEAMVKEHFASVDINKDGAITREEIQQGMQQHRAERLDQMFKAMDADSNGSISRAEFDAAHQDKAGAPYGGMKHDMGAGPMGAGPGSMGAGPGPMAGGHKGPMAHDGMGHHGKGHRMMGGQMLERADANKDGKVTLVEATSSALAHFDEVDTNKDKTITPEERRAFHEKMRAARKTD